MCLLQMHSICDSLRSGVIERRQEGLMFSAWLPVLAVLTADRAMHLFQLPKV
jgi:hypothetical protein